MKPKQKRTWNRMTDEEYDIAYEILGLKKPKGG